MKRDINGDLLNFNVTTVNNKICYVVFYKKQTIFYQFLNFRRNEWMVFGLLRAKCFISIELR